MPVETGSCVLAALQRFAVLLAEAEEELNGLNVFPVADRDTGTNLRRTVERLLVELGGAADRQSIGSAIAGAALEAARGNSGLICSQYLATFVGCSVSHPTIDGAVLANCLTEAAQAARAAVARPVEGTILTVADAAAVAADTVTPTAAKPAAAPPGGLGSKVEAPTAATPGATPPGGLGSDTVTPTAAAPVDADTATPTVAAPDAAPPGGPGSEVEAPTIAAPADADTATPTVVGPDAAPPGGPGSEVGAPEPVTDVAERVHGCSLVALGRTTEQLAVLAEAGVVDAGAAGLVLFFQALAETVSDRGQQSGLAAQGAAEPGLAGQVPAEQVPAAQGAAEQVPAAQVPADQMAAEQVPAAPGPVELQAGGTVPRFVGFELQFTAEGSAAVADELRRLLAARGTDVVVSSAEGLIRAHAHTPDLGPMLEAVVERIRPRNIVVEALMESTSP